MLSILTAQWKPILLGLATAALIILGMKVQGWREDSAKLVIVKAERDAAVKAQVDADIARGKAELALLTAKGIVQTQIKEVVKRVPIVVPDRAGCEFSADAVRLFNLARSGKLPPTSGGTTDTTPASPSAGRGTP